MQDKSKYSSSTVLSVESPEQNEASLLTVLIKMVAHFSAFLFAGIIIYYSFASEITLFSWHPALMALGSSLLIVEGILIFSKNSSLFPSMARASKASIHYWLVGIGVLCMVAGGAAIYRNKEIKGKSHFTSWHGIIGAMTTTYMCVQSLAGVFLKYHRSLSGFIKIKLVDMKLYHATSGLMAFLMVTITLILALQTGWASHYLPWYLWYVCMACVSTSALVVMTHITSTYLPVAMKKQPQA